MLDKHVRVKGDVGPSRIWLVDEEFYSVFHAKLVALLPLTCLSSTLCFVSFPALFRLSSALFFFYFPSPF